MQGHAKKTTTRSSTRCCCRVAVEVEHDEIGVYENLIISATAMGREDVIAVLERNLGSEQHTLGGVKRLQQHVAAVTHKQPAEGGVAGKINDPVT